MAVSACLSRDIIDTTLKKMCHEHEGIEAMTEPFLHKDTKGSLSALQEDPQSRFAEILVRAPEKPEICPPSPLCPDLSETCGSAECHQCVHMESQRLSPAVAGARYFRCCLPPVGPSVPGSRTGYFCRCLSCPVPYLAMTTESYSAEQAAPYLAIRPAFSNRFIRLAM
ncbi:uncharacterized protein ACIBXB_013306 isoform 1-T1 [Morphnus guianensis]